MDEKLEESPEELSYVKILKKIIRFLFGETKPPLVIRFITIVLLIIHFVEFLLFTLVSVFVLLSPERYYQKSVLIDFADLGDDFFYGYTLLQVVLIAILLLLWRMKTVAVYLYTIFSFVEILIPYFLVKNTGFPWEVLLINLVVVLALFYLVGKEKTFEVEENNEELDEDEEVELPF